MVDSSGSTMPAEVTMATVVEPTAKRMMMAINQAISTGLMFMSVSTSPSTLPMPQSWSTWLKAPPAPMISRMLAIGLKHSSVIWPIFSIVMPRATPSDQ